MPQATIHIDGGSRGNPGDASYAVVAKTRLGDVIEDTGYLGKTTNNVAEYTALIKALELAIARGWNDIQVFSDSELIVKQMNGEYRVKNADIRTLYEQAIDRRNKVGTVNLTHIRREENKRADELCNQTLDREQKKEGKPTTKSTTPKTIKQVTQISDGRVRADCLECLQSAQACWSRGEPLPDAAMVWEQLWSILEEAGVLKK